MSDAPNPPKSVTPQTDADTTLQDIISLKSNPGLAELAGFTENDNDKASSKKSLLEAAAGED